MSEKTPNTPSGGEILNAQEREKLSQRCVSQKFHESLIFFKGVEAHNTIDAQYQITSAQSRVRRNPAASSSGNIGRDSIPNTRETMHSKEARENSGGSTKVQSSRKTSGSFTNNPRPGSNNSSSNISLHANHPPRENPQVQRTNSTKELHDVYEELNRLKAVVEKLTLENKELLTENSHLRKENRELKTQKSYFGSKPKENNLPSIDLPPRDSSGDRTPSQPNSTADFKHESGVIGKHDEASSHAEVTLEDETKDTTTTQEETIQAPTNNKSTDTTTTTKNNDNKNNDNNNNNDKNNNGESSQKVDDSTIVILPPSADRKFTPSITLTSSEADYPNVTATTSPYGTIKTKGEDGSDVIIPSSIENLTYTKPTSNQNLTSPTERSPKKERVPSNRQKHSSTTKTENGHTSKSTKLYVEKPSKSSRRSLQLEDSSIVNSLGSSDKEKNGKSSNERSKDHGSVRKKGRPKSQDMSDLIGADIQIERGACNTKESETCLRCTHALTDHALPDTDKTPKSPKKTSSNERREDRKSVQLSESKKVAVQESPVKPKVQIVEPVKAELIKSDASSTAKEEEGTDFHGIGDDLAAKWVIPYSELVFVEKLGKGISSVVYTGKWKGNDVAIKVLRLETKFINDCKGELMIMSQIVSPYVVHFYGATLDTKLAVVMEICANGSLFHCLQNTAIPIFWKRVLNWTLQIVHGMNILHEWNPVILHRDMKSLNLLVDADWNLKLCDFGLSRFNTEASQAQTLAKLRGTYTYTAPEMYFKNKYTTKSDVFSMGVIFWELVARLMNGKYIRPYSEYKDINMDYQIIYRVATKGLRPTMPVGCPESYAALIMRCLDNSPEIRPSCKELIEIINGLKKEFKKKKQKWKKSEFVEKKEAAKK